MSASRLPATTSTALTAVAAMTTGVVACLDRLDEDATHPGPGKDGFDEHGARKSAGSDKPSSVTTE
jgi:hypothetical protein